MTALVAALRDVLDGRRLVAVLSVLDDKDAAAMLGELGPLCSELIVTRAANPRTLPPATLESLARQLGSPPTRSIAEPHDALAAAREAAGTDGVVLVTDPCT